MNKRHLSIISAFSGASLLCLPVYADEGNQQEWVLDALAQRYGQAQNIPPMIIVDKVNATATAFREGEVVFKVDILLGQSKKDVLQPGISVFKQKVTPAGYFNDVKVIFDPNVNINNYYKQMLVSYTPFMDVNGKQETLAFHSILNPKKDGKNVSDGNADNNSVSNGCIRMSYDDLEKMLDFTVGQKKNFLEVAPKRNNFSYMPSSVSVIILPQEDRSKKNTLRILDAGEQNLRRTVQAQKKTNSFLPSFLKKIF